VVVLLALELRLYDKVERRTPLTLLEVLLGALAVAGLTTLAIKEALAPLAEDEDQTRLSSRTRLVYLAEVLLLALFIHVRINIPGLRTVASVHYWPTIVMVLAFTGAGLGELFRRRGLEVLAGPLHRTGLLLPLLPLVAFWFRPSPEVFGPAQEVAPGLAPVLAPLQYLPGYRGYLPVLVAAHLLLLLIRLARRSLF